MTNEEKKVYTARETFKEARSKSTKGRNFRWVVYTIDGKTYGFFNPSDQIDDVSKIKDLRSGDKFIAHYTEEMWNEKMYYTLEEVEIEERDVNADVRPPAPGGGPPAAVAPDIPAESRIRRAACDITARLYPSIKPEGITTGENVAVFLLTTHAVAEYIDKGEDFDVECIKGLDLLVAQMREGAPEDLPSPEEREEAAESPVADDYPIDTGESDPEGEFPPEPEDDEAGEAAEEKPEPKKKEEKAHARRTSAKSS